LLIAIVPVLTGYPETESNRSAEQGASANQV